MNTQVKKLIDNGDISKATILNNVKYWAERWAQDIIDNYDWEYVPTADTLSDRFWDYLDDTALEKSDDFLSDILDNKLYDSLTEDEFESALDYMIGIKYFDETTQLVDDIMDSAVETIGEMLGDTNPNNFPWGPGMSQKDFI